MATTAPFRPLRQHEQWARVKATGDIVPVLLSRFHYEPTYYNGNTLRDEYRATAIELLEKHPDSDE